MSFFSGLEFWLVYHTLMYENSESKVFKNIELFGEISNNWPNHLLWKNGCNNLESCW